LVFVKKKASGPADDGFEDDLDCDVDISGVLDAVCDCGGGGGDDVVVVMVFGR
jgi:hypothetical protein